MNTEESGVTNLGTSAAVAADIVARHMKPELLNVAPDGLGPIGPEGSKEVPVLVLPTGLKAHSIKPFLDAYRTAPERIKGTARLVELESLIDHAKRFSDDDSALFAEPHDEEPRLTAVFDYHRRRLQVVEGALPSAARFGEHRAVYSFPISDEWEAWLAKNGEWMTQADFAAFLDDRILDVADPDSAFNNALIFKESLGIASFASPNRLLLLSRGLTIHVDEKVTSKISPSTGETTLLFSQEHNDEHGAPLEVPRAFLVQIPVFRAGVAYQLAVRLKYRTGGGKVMWSYEIHDPRRYFDDAFRNACERAREQTKLPLFYGSPEST